MTRLKNFTIITVLGAMALLMTAAPLLAAEEEHGRAGSTTSYFTAFLKTDNPLGTALIWVCLLFSIAIVSIVIQNVLWAREKVYTPPALADSVEQMLADKQYKEAMELTAEDKSPFGQVMAAALHEAPRGFNAMESAIEEKADEINNRRVRALIWLEVAGAAGPMIGLFGTVFGMILSFQNMLNQGGQPKAAELAGGIATALVCTFWGLIVGIPGVIAASILRVRVEGLTAECILKAKRLIAPFRPGAGGKKPTTGGATGPATPKPQPA